VRGNITRMSTAVVDLETMVRSAAQRHPGLPMFLYGHSMGALVALNLRHHRAPGRAERNDPDRCGH
jgi:alpha-beta hydrolase superfamily lysophospholipase